MMNGILNVYKEKGYTSHDVVAKLRGILKQKKIGHTGTLDPDATGVLPVCLGNGTRLCDMLTDTSKEYLVTFILGVETDTQDMTGTILAEKQVSITEQEIEKTIMNYVGEYDQLPPMYSALKVNGKKLYELAREGKTVERALRPVCIDFISIKKIQLPEVTMLVGCSKGTYIRTLCHDIGQDLGCGGAMSSLERTRVGFFAVEDAIDLKTIERLREEGKIESKLVAVDSVFFDLGKHVVKAEYRKLIDNGNPLEADCLYPAGKNEIDKRIRIYNDEDVFCGIYEYREDKKKYFPFKIFPN
ncbi:MAG: tRNA pseudouridine(55) synthase TruB [Clostridiales bacterium]|nr:tRNA pseudouridine(55) synthase TruB [Clostridiales bacterium]